tara:strand:- start:92 stop:256 length:165 start_codon:yes stop_codon:yes gene_type:complete
MDMIFDEDVEDAREETFVLLIPEGSETVLPASPPLTVPDRLLAGPCDETACMEE